MDEPDIAVVGAGIAGASTAYHLADRTDRRVVVYERGEVAGETTARSAAYFGFYGTGVERRLKRYGMELYNEFLGAPRAAPYHDLVGRLRVATTDGGADDLQAYAGGQEPEAGVSYHDGETLPASVLVPDLDFGRVAGASYRAHVGYHRPRELAREFVARARDRGVRFETGTAVTDIVADDRVRELVVDGGTGTTAVAPEAVVCAAGPWNPRLCRTAGVSLPASHSLAPILKLGREEPPATLPIVSHHESGVYARGDGDSAVLVGHHPGEPDPGTEYDPAAVDDRVPGDLREEMWRVTGDLLPGLADAPVVDEWVGVRSHTPDGNPVLGWTGVAGLSVVAFNSSGIQLSPAAGRIVARQLLEGAPTDHYGDVSISRFDGHDDQPFSL